MMVNPSLSDMIFVIRRGRTDLFMSIRKLLFFFIALLSVASCNADPSRMGGIAIDDLSTKSITLTPKSDQFHWYQVYFTEPDSAKASTLRDGPDVALAEAIHRARLSVELAADSLDLWSLREALLAAHRRGVDVRVVIETDNLASEEVQELIENGIPVRDDRSEGLMHNKFVIIDRLEVWTGSMNLMIG